MKITSAEFIKGIRGTDAILADGIPNIAFIGRSNVGKSSILNTLTGKKDLARVGKKPGKTTEINFFLVNRTHYFVDLPGYGYAAPAQRDREKLRKLIIWYFTSGEVRPQKVVLILEAKAGLTRFDEEMLKILKELGYSYVVVLNKVDKLSQKEIADTILNIRQVVDVEIFQTSTETGQGIDALREKLLPA
ncbi:MAG: ribosome biogenesis GTP-binding protein YihA/YsxC [Patescibacteria group bacterium]